MSSEQESVSDAITPITVEIVNMKEEDGQESKEDVAQTSEDKQEETSATIHTDEKGDGEEGHFEDKLETGDLEVQVANDVAAIAAATVAAAASEESSSTPPTTTATAAKPALPISITSAVTGATITIGGPHPTNPFPGMMAGVPTFGDGVHIPAIMMPPMMMGFPNPSLHMAHMMMPNTAAKMAISTSSAAASGRGSQPNEELFDNYLRELAEFKNKHHRLPKSRECAIGKWLNTQKRTLLDASRFEKHPEVKQKRISMLEALGVCFDEGSRKTLTRKSWDENFRDLVQFQKDYKRNPKKNECALGQWFCDQRRRLQDDNYMKDFAEVKAQRIKLFEETGITFTSYPSSGGATKRKTWETNYDELSNFKKKYARLPERGECPSAAWLYDHTRYLKDENYLKGKPEKQERIEKLRKLGVDI